MNYKILQKEEEPLEAQAWLEENKLHEGQNLIQSENKTYLIITNGEKRSGGYRFELEEVQEHDDEIVVKVKFISPLQDQIVIQMLTLPYILIEFDKTEKNITVQFKNQLGL